MKFYFIKLALFKANGFKNWKLKKLKNKLIEEYTDTKAHYIAGAENHETTSVIKRKLIQNDSVLYVVKWKLPERKYCFLVGLFVPKLDCIIGHHQGLILYKAKTKKEAIKIYEQAKKRILDIPYWGIYHSVYWGWPFWKIRIPCTIY